MQRIWRPSRAEVGKSGRGHYDLIIAGIASLRLILLIMMFITRSLVAALVIVGTVALSLGASFALSDASRVDRAVQQAADTSIERVSFAKQRAELASCASSRPSTPRR